MSEFKPRLLVVMRHAKSDWPDDVADHERSLAGRGKRDAPRAGRWLRESGYLPDTVLCSTARRTRQTWELMARELATSPEESFEPRIYEATALGLLMLVRELPDDRHTVLLIGHNPGVAEFAAGLADRPTDGMPKFPAAAMAVFAVPLPWAEAVPGECSLLDFVTPAQFPR